MCCLKYSMEKRNCYIVNWCSAIYSVVVPESVYSYAFNMEFPLEQGCDIIKAYISNKNHLNKCEYCFFYKFRDKHS